MKYPIVFITIPILLGVVFSYYVEVDIPAIIFLLVLGLLFCLIGIKLNYSMTFGLAIILFLLGMALFSFRLESSQLIKYTDKPVRMVGSVEEVVDISENRNKFIVRVHGLKVDSSYVKIDEKLMLNIIGHRDIRLGDRLRFNGVLREPLPNTNPYLYNHKLNLLSHGIFTTCTIREYQIEEVAKGKLNFLTAFKVKAKDKVEKVLDLYLAHDTSTIMKSILLGNYRYLEEEKVEQFRNLGLAHIIAVSGLHIGIVTSLLIYFFAYMRIKRRLNLISSIIIIWAYAYIIGSPVSVIRANIMYTILLLSQLFRRPYDSLNSLFFALLLMVIINPFWLFHVGFQLSFITTFFVVYYTPRISRIFYFPRKGLFKGLSSIFAAQLGILPLLAYYFNRIPTVGLVANLLLVPIFNICLVLTILLVPLSFVSSYLASSMGLIINGLLNVQTLGMNILSYFPVLYIKVRTPSILEIILYYIIIFMVFDIIGYRNIKERAFKLFLIFFVAFLLTTQLMSALDNSLTIEFIDVGQGDSILIRGKEGNYLIDTGGDIFGQFHVGENILLPYLEKQGIFKLKGVFISHFDMDHCGSLPYLMDNIDIENLYIGYVDEGNELYRLIKDKATEKRIPIYILKKGEFLKLASNTHALVVGPDKGLLDVPKREGNDLSLVLLIKHLDKKILFTGDIEREGERNVVESLKTTVDLLKVPHHGSNTSSSVEFLEKLKPKAAVISVGRNNMFGHPHGEVIKRYEENNINLYRTDKLGLIRAHLDREDFVINGFLKERIGLLYIIKTYNLFISNLLLCSILMYIVIRYFTKLDEEMNRIGLERVYE